MGSAFSSKPRYVGENEPAGSKKNGAAAKPPPSEISGVLRWGIASASRVSHDVALVMEMLPDEHKIVAVGSRKVDNAKYFARKFNISQVYGSYEELAEDSHVDVVFVGAVTSAHYDITKLMLSAKKHVVCAKPLTVNAKQARELVDLARQNDVFFMEGMWSRFFPAYDQVRQELAEQTIGEVQFIHINFGLEMLIDGHPRDKSLGVGALLDLGCYAVQIFTMVFGEPPENIQATGKIVDGVDVEDKVTLSYKNGCLGQANFSINAVDENNATIGGSEGMLLIPEFWSPTSLVTVNKTYEYPLYKPRAPAKHTRGEGMLYQMRAVRESILEGEKECALMPLEHTLMNIDVMDEIRRQVGVTYAADKSHKT